MNFVLLTAVLAAFSEIFLPILRDHNCLTFFSLFTVIAHSNIWNNRAPCEKDVDCYFLSPVEIKYACGGHATFVSLNIRHGPILQLSYTLVTLTNEYSRQRHFFKVIRLRRFRK